MKKLIVAALAAAAIALPAVPAAASEAIPQPVGTESCPSGFTGIVVWVNTQPTGYREYPFCIHGPAAAVADGSSARAGITRCGAAGHFIVWYYDLDNRYREVWNSCI